MNVLKDRLNGYKQALFNRNIEVDNELIIEMMIFQKKNGYLGAKSILEKNKVSTFCNN